MFSPFASIFLQHGYLLKNLISHEDFSKGKFFERTDSVLYFSEGKRTYEPDLTLLALLDLEDKEHQ